MVVLEDLICTSLQPLKVQVAGGSQEVHVAHC